MKPKILMQNGGTMKTLQINEIFSSINGEISPSHQGSMCTFIRLQGCPLRCLYCDTKKAQNPSAGTPISIYKIMKEVEKQKNVNVTITGGEPLLQKKILEKLVLKLIEKHRVSIETNGSFPIPKDWPWCDINVSWVVDYKLPYSGESAKMKEDHFYGLNKTDMIKFVVSCYGDFVFAVRMTEKIHKDYSERTRICPVFAFSPCLGKIDPMKLYEYMNKSDFLKNIGAVYSLQLHKIIGVS